VVADSKNGLTSGIFSEKFKRKFVDEYGPRRHLGMDDLKGLTSGTAQGFSCNHKSFGASYKPRPDVQLITLSNKHLFDSMGQQDRKTKTRKVSAADVGLLDQRFTVLGWTPKCTPRTLKLTTMMMKRCLEKVVLLTCWLGLRTIDN